MVTNARQPLPTWRDFIALGWLTTTDHKRIGVMFIAVGVVMAAAVGIPALLLALDLDHAPFGLLDQFAFEQVWLLQSTGAVFAVGLPIALGLASAVAPLQIGARRLVWPQLNALGFWILLGGVLLMMASPAAGDAEALDPSAEELALAAPLSEQGRDFWVLGLILVGLGASLTGVALLATIVRGRAPGMTVANLPMFAWASALFAVATVASALLVGIVGAVFLADAGAATAFPFDVVGTDGEVLAFYANPFWFFANPFLYALFIPVIGAISELLPVLGRTTLRGRGLVIAGMVGVALLAVLLALFHAIAAAFSRSVDDELPMASFILLIPLGLCVLGWVATLRAGAVSPASPATPSTGLCRLLSPLERAVRPASPAILAVGTVVVLALGTALALALGFPGDYNDPASFHVTAQFQGMLGGALALGLLAGLHYWFPKLTGRALDPCPARLQAILAVVGATMVLCGQHVLGESSLGRGLSSGLAGEWSSGAQTGSAIVLAGFLLLFFGFAGFIAEALKSLMWGKRVGNDPWEGATLEWYTSSPPPPDNFPGGLPEVRTARPLADLRRRHSRPGHG